MGVFTTSLKGLFRLASPISFLVTTVRSLVRSSTSSKLRRIGDTLLRLLYSFTIDLRADRYPSICSLAEGVVLMRRVSTFSIGSPPEVDPLVLPAILTGVAPMVSPGVPLSSSPVILVLYRARALQVPEIYETNALASSWGCPKTKLRQHEVLSYIYYSCQVSDEILGTQSHEFKRTSSLCVVLAYLSEALLENLSEMLSDDPFGYLRRHTTAINAMRHPAISLPS
ncbi:hypothetical protein Tco_0810401 [Tanacetum coccineum]